MVKLVFHDTAVRAKRAFEPRDPCNVTMYVCGPTVYSRAHIGNARPVVVFDVLFRLLRYVYGEQAVTYVRNITDIDDKIIAAAKESGRSTKEITEETIRWFHQDAQALGALSPTHEPRATEFVEGMVAMIRQLLERGHAYVAKGHVLFRTSSFDSYGLLSGRSREEMIAGARVEVAPYKNDPADFVLWKPSSGDQPGWDSPWGRGRPGWHIECSAMSRDLLGDEFDIHAGGVDLVFPHHENERAQSIGIVPETKFARYWMHNGLLSVEGKKMAKSLGNVISLESLLEEQPGEVVRLAFLATHYRQPLDWTARSVAEARVVLSGWRRSAGEAAPDSKPPESVLAALAEDLNTPRAITEMHKLARMGNAGALRSAGALLGILGDELGAWAREAAVDPRTAALVDELMTLRGRARREGDFGKADELRDRLKRAGIVVFDTASGTKWRPSADFSGQLPADLRKEVCG